MVDIFNDPEYIIGLTWGKPRPGHPEGSVQAHINDVIANIDTVYKDDDDYEKHIFIARVHDTFKYQVGTSLPKSGENHHAMKARRFAEKYIDDKDVLDIIELHDEAYNSWRKGSLKNDWDGATKRANKLINRLGKNIDLYLKFYICDNSTGDKKGDDYIWFESMLS